MLGAEKHSEYSPGTSVCMRGKKKPNQAVEETVAVLHGSHLADHLSVLLRSHANLSMRLRSFRYINADASGESNRTVHVIRGRRHFETM